MLQHVAFHYFTVNELTSKVKSFVKTIEFDENLKTRHPLASSVSEAMLRRMAFEGIKYNDLLSTYHLGADKLIKLLEKRVRWERGNSNEKKKKILRHFGELLRK